MNAEPSDDPNFELRQKLKNLIIDSLAVKYISTSSHMDYKTGNAYQSISLDDNKYGGYRADRKELFELFQFHGKTVVDCGCNLGELSRLAIARGAKLVDGIEYDPYFVNIARLINCYRGISRISVNQGDLTKADTISDQYDVALAFSVFPYLLPVLKQVSTHVSDVLVIETHNVTVNILKVYVEPVAKFFPFYTFVGMTDFGKGEGERAVIVFAKHPRLLQKGGFVEPRIIVAQSQFSFLDAIFRVITQVSSKGVRRTEDIREIVEKSADLPNDEKMITAGVTYWITLMKGYLEFYDTQELRSDNSYVVFLKKLLNEFDFDLALKSKLENEKDLMERVRLRFDDITRLAGDDQRELANIDPIIVFNPGDNRGRYTVQTSLKTGALRCDLLDGYHRVMWSMFFGYSDLPAWLQYG